MAKLRPRHLAAIQYSILAIFFLASWHVMLSPYDTASGQLKFMFAEGYEYRNYFVVLASVTVATLLVALTFWFPRSAMAPLAGILAVASITLFAAAVWKFDDAFVLVFGLGMVCAVWSWRAPNTPLFRVRQGMGGA